jgi:hypothetical protein
VGAIAIALTTLVVPARSLEAAAAAAVPVAPVAPETSAVAYRLPFAAGQSIKVVQGWNTRYSHHGRSAFAYDFKLPVGTPVLAAAAGVVSYIHKGSRACGGSELRGAANYVTINHADGTATQYGHLSRVDVAVGDEVAEGQQIALAGRSGYTSCVAHLHFARQAQGGAVTQSRPIYFREYPGVQFKSGMYVEANPEACGAPAPGVSTGAFCGTYFYGTAERLASMAETNEAIDFEWSSGRPTALDIDTHGTGAAAFSVRWVGTFDFSTTGSYDFALTTSDGVRLSIDGDVVLDSWADPAELSEILLSRTLLAGAHVIELEYHHGAGDAVIRLGWSRSYEGPRADVR